MSLDTGIAIAGMWLAVAVVGWHAPEAAVPVAVFAMGATIVVAR